MFIFSGSLNDVKGAGKPLREDARIPNFLGLRWVRADGDASVIGDLIPRIRAIWGPGRSRRRGRRSCVIVIRGWCYGMERVGSRLMLLCLF